eukprot:scaffold164414_cov34-Prasinocladus_malaysianus.AAC.1
MFRKINEQEVIIGSLQQTVRPPYLGPPHVHDNLNVRYSLLFRACALSVTHEAFGHRHCCDS